MLPAWHFRGRGEDVVRESYADFADERRKVIAAARKLIASGVSPGNICLLSHYRFENSCLQGEKAKAPQIIGGERYYR